VNVGQTSSNKKKEFYNEELHKNKDYPLISDKIKLLTKGSSDDNFEGNTLQKTIPKTKKRKWHDNKLFGDLKKIRPPNFDGEFEEGEKAWILNMGKYFQIYNYLGNLRVRFSMYQDPNGGRRQNQ